MGNYMRSVIKLKGIITALFIFMFYLMLFDLVLDINGYYNLYLEYFDYYGLWEELSKGMVRYIVFDVLEYIPLLILFYTIISTLEKIVTKLLVSNGEENDYIIMNEETIFYRFDDYVKFIRFDIIILLIYCVSRIVLYILHFLNNSSTTFSDDSFTVYDLLMNLNNVLLFAFMFVLIYSLSEIANIRRTFLNNTIQFDEESGVSEKNDVSIIIVIILFLAIIVWGISLLVYNLQGNLEYIDFLEIIYFASSSIVNVSYLLLLLIGPLSLLYITLISPINPQIPGEHMLIIKNEKKLNKFLVGNYIIAIVAFLITLPGTYNLGFVDVMYYFITVLLILLFLLMIKRPE